MKTLLVLVAMVGSVMCGGIDLGLNLGLGGHQGPVYLGHTHGYNGYGGHGHGHGHGHPHGHPHGNGLGLGYGSHQHGHTVALTPVHAPVYAHVPVHSHGHGHGHALGHGHVTNHYSGGFSTDIVLGGGGHPHHSKHLSLGLGHGNGLELGYAIGAEVAKAPVAVKKAVVPVVSAHNYDYNAFKPITKAPVVIAKHIHKEPLHYAPTDYEIVPSISYGYSYKLVPTHTFGPQESHHGHNVHHPIPVAKEALPLVSVSHHAEPHHGHGEKTIGLNFGLDIGRGHGHHH